MVKFYKCDVCGNIAYKVVDKNIPISCCGKVMSELHANSVEASVEKHIPYVTFENGKVNVVVGETLHPYTTEHHISFIALETKNGVLLKELDPIKEPKASFNIDKEDVISVYAYCNLHGLWKKDL